MHRPRGIAIVAVLLGLYGALAVLLGVLSIVAYGAGGDRPDIDQTLLRELAVVGAVTLVLGGAQLVVAWALWTLRQWAWWLTIVLQGISVVEALWAMSFTEVTSVDTAVFTSLAFSLVVVGYFLSPGVRAAFGR